MPNERRDATGMFVSKEAEKWEPDQLDLDILRILPDEGEKKGRYLLSTMTTAQIKKALDPTLPSGYLSVKMRRMTVKGLLVVTGGRSGHSGQTYQRTAKARELVEKHAREGEWHEETT